MGAVGPTMLSAEPEGGGADDDAAESADDDAAAAYQASWPPPTDDGQFERAKLDGYARVQMRMQRNPKNKKQWLHGWECKEQNCLNVFTLSADPASAFKSHVLRMHDKPNLWQFDHDVKLCSLARYLYPNRVAGFREKQKQCQAVKKEKKETMAATPPTCGAAKAAVPSSFDAAILLYLIGKNM